MEVLSGIFLILIGIFLGLISHANHKYESFVSSEMISSVIVYAFAGWHLIIPGITGVIKYLKLYIYRG